MLVPLTIQAFLPMTTEFLLLLKNFMIINAAPISDNTQDYYSNSTFNVTSTLKRVHTTVRSNYEYVLLALVCTCPSMQCKIY